MSATHAETSPLLQARAASPQRGTTNQRANKPAPSSGGDAQAWRNVIIPLLLMCFVDAVAVNLSDVAMATFGEDNLCRMRYPDAGHGNVSALVPNDPRCKGSEVQSELSMLQAVELSIGILPSILTSVLYGVVADRYGRRPILALSILGLFILYVFDYTIYRFPSIFNVYWIWPVALTTFIGGGTPVMQSMMLAMVTDVVSEAQRSTIFFYLVAAQLVGRAVGAPFTYYVMTYGPWFTAMVSMSLFLLAFLVIVFLCHETVPTALEATDSDGSPSDNVNKHDGAISAAFASMLNPVGAIKQTSSAFFTLFWVHKKVGMLLVTLLFSDLGTYANILFNQYIAKRFDWSWSQANLLASVQTVSRLALMVAVMPLVGHLLNKAGLPPIIKDAQISRYALLLATVSMFGIAFANNFASILPFLPLTALQAVSRASLNSLLPSLTGQDHVGMLYSVMATLDALGLMISAPAVAYLFKIGLSLGGIWIGLPYILAGGLLLTSTVILFAVRIRREDHFAHGEVLEEDE